MPIQIRPLKRKSLCEVLDPLGLTLVIQEEHPDQWSAIMVDSDENEFDLFAAWGLEPDESDKEALETVAHCLSNSETELEDIVIDCTDVYVEVGTDGAFHS